MSRPESQSRSCSMLAQSKVRLWPIRYLWDPSLSVPLRAGLRLVNSEVPAFRNATSQGTFGQCLIRVCMLTADQRRSNQRKNRRSDRHFLSELLAVSNSIAIVRNKTVVRSELTLYIRHIFWGGQIPSQLLNAAVMELIQGERLLQAIGCCGSFAMSRLHSRRNEYYFGE
jgi:hypothetical protein